MMQTGSNKEYKKYIRQESDDYDVDDDDKSDTFNVSASQASSTASAVESVFESAPVSATLCIRCISDHAFNELTEPHGTCGFTLIPIISNISGIFST